MTCTEFRDRYTEFRDGVVTAPREVRRFRRHLAFCASCRRYDTAVRRGSLALQAAGEIEPSSAFRARLEARLARERLVGAPVPAHAGLAAGLFVAMAISLLALEAGGRPHVIQAPTLPAVAFPKPVANAGLPFVSFQDPRASVVAGNPNLYGTALVEAASAQVEPATAGR